MTTPLDKAKRRLAALRLEIREIERFIEMYEAFEHVVHVPQGGNSKETGDSISAPVRPVDNYPIDHDVPIPSPRRRNGTPPKTIVNLVERLVREAGQPLTRGEILNRLQARDVEITVADQARYVGTIMWRNKGKFINIEGRGYWLRGEPIPPHPHITAGRYNDDEDPRDVDLMNDEAKMEEALARHERERPPTED